MKKSIKKNLIMSFTAIFLVISVLGILYGLDLYWVGFHNVDAGQNWRWVECRYNATIGDYYDIDQYLTPIESIIIGSEQNYAGYLITSFSAFFAGYLFCLLLTKCGK